MSSRTASGLLAAVLVLLWGRALLPGLWLDETATAWVTSDGLATTFERVRAFQGQYPLYFGLVWATRALLGPSELALRLPSLLALGAALVLLARLGARLVDREAGRLAALFLAGLAYHEAADARPYALALLAVVLAALAAVRWGERPTLARGAALAAAGALVPWAHPLFALALPALLWLGLARARTAGSRVGPGALAAVLGLAALLVLPIVPWLLALHARRAAISYATQPRLLDLVLDLARPRALGALALGLALAAIPRAGSRRPRLDRPPGAPGLALPLLAWHALPHAVAFVVARSTDAQIYVSRYLDATLPALALLLAWTTRAVAPPRARALVAAAFVALSVARYGEREDWRRALELVRACSPDPATLVLVRPGLVESNDPAFGEDPERRAYLASPLAAYPLDAHGADVRLVPHSLVKATEPVFEELVAAGARSPRTILVCRTNASVLGWLDRRLGVAGVTSRVVSSEFDRLRVVVYERR